MMFRKDLPADLWKDPLHLLAIGFGAGAFKFAPGTMGTLVAVPLFLLLAPLPFYAYVSIALLIMLLGVVSGERAAKVLGESDPGPVVVDEIAGYLITMMAIPADWYWLIAGFLLFRLFDILKPWPCKRLERLPGGWGIMMDDVAAGLYACGVLHAVMFWK